MQAALDRRRFAVAKDTPLKVTPLHVATLFGKTPIIKYLGKFFFYDLKFFFLNYIIRRKISGVFESDRSRR